MNMVFPNIRLRALPALLGYAVLGSLLAGIYGILHDQITYSISPEYFTGGKFKQFHYADFGFPPRVFVAEIGFLATWWVGFIAAWFIARINLATCPPGMAFRRTMQGFSIIFAVAAAAFVVGYLLGILWTADSNSPVWTHFLQVAFIHDAGYLGGLIGLIVAILFLRRANAREG
jgi:hypothetical protein